MNLREIRGALAKAMKAQGFHVYDTLPDEGRLPLVAVTWPDRVQYHETMTGGSVITILLTAAVANVDFAAAQRQIDDLMSSDGGLLDKLEAFETVAWDDAVMIESGNVRVVTVGAQALAVDFILEVRA